MEPKRPVLLLDVMSTLVTEPFLEHIPKFFGMTLEQLIASRDPRPWIEFEHGRITEEEYAARYFNDGRQLDLEGFKAMLFGAYDWMDGVPELLAELKAAGYPMYALSNYSSWYEIIEAKLKLSRFIEWDFVSCLTGHRKPDADAYLTPLKQLGGAPDGFIFVDDRQHNVDGATAVGMKGILRTESIADLRRDLTALGIAV